MTLFENLYEGLKSLLGGGGANSNMSLEEKRQAYRIGCHINVSIKTEVAVFTALCTDIGSTGLRIECSEREKIKKLSKLVINIADRKTGALGPPIPGEVVWRRRIGDTGRVYVGVCYNCKPESLKSTWVGPFLDKLGYHAKAKAAERRRHVRLGSGLAVEMRGTEGLLGSGKLIDLSGGGCKADVNGACKIGADVVMKIGPIEGHAPLEVPASVVNCREDSDSNRYIVRTRFVSLEPNVHKALKKYLTTLQKRNSTI